MFVSKKKFNELVERHDKIVGDYNDLLETAKKLVGHLQETSEKGQAMIMAFGDVLKSVLDDNYERADLEEFLDEMQEELVRIAEMNGEEV